MFVNLRASVEKARFKINSIFGPKEMNTPILGKVDCIDGIFIGTSAQTYKEMILILGCCVQLIDDVLHCRGGGGG